MKQLQIIPQIHRCETFKKFAGEFALSRHDLIFTETIIYEQYIKEAGLECSLILRDEYGGGEPTDEMVNAIALELQGIPCSRIVAIGGGSVIDIAKLLSLKDPYPITRIMNGEIPIVKGKGLIIVPTTCGTGSEVTNGSIVTMAESGLKTALNHEAMPANHSVLIPELLSGLPPTIFYSSSIDALAHAAEAFMSPKANPFTDAYSLKACSLIINGFVDIILNGEEYRKELLGDFVTASCMGGVTVNNAGAGPVHALAYPLGEHYKVPHGVSIYQFFSQVFHLYTQRVENERMNQLIDTLARPLTRLGVKTSRHDFFLEFEAVLSKVLPLQFLRALGMKQEEIPLFASEMMAKERLLVNSPVPFTQEDAQMIYQVRF